MKMDSRLEIPLSILAYSFCSGTLLLLNKMVLHHLPFPSLVTTTQLVATLAFIYIAKLVTTLPLDPIRWKYVVPYSYYIVAFAMGVYCNMKSLSLSNVETVIVFKALSPCVVSVADALFLGREYPSLRSWGALSLIVVGSLGYASQDEKFQTQGIKAYMWPFFYLFMISFEMAYGKSLLKSVDLKTLSGPVVYTNMLGIPPMMLFAALGQEYSKFFNQHVMEHAPISFAACFVLFLSCAAGTGIGYAGWWCRGTVSATSFSLIGVMNKCLTILLNILVWDQHATPFGTASLLLCLVGGSLYRQAPMRASKVQSLAKQSVASANASVFDNNGDESQDLEKSLLSNEEEEAPPTESSSKRS